MAKVLLSESQARSLYRMAEELLPELRYRKLQQLYRAVLEAATEELPVLFPSLASRLYYLLNTWPFPEDFRLDLELIGLFFRQRANRPSLPLSAVLATLLRLIAMLSELPVPPVFRSILHTPALDAYRAEPPEHFAALEVRVKQRLDEGPGEVLLATSPLTGSLCIRLGEPWDINGRFLWRNATVVFYGLAKVSATPLTYETTPDAFMVLEPDYLVDVSEVLQTVWQKHFDPETLVLHWLEHPLEYKPQLVEGILVNECFDLLILHPELSDEEIVQRAFQRHFSAFAVLPDAGKAGTEIESLRHRVLPHLPILRAVLEFYRQQDARITVEPTFLSPRYGLVGRLDLLVEYADQPDRKDVVELKSGKPPGGPWAVQETLQFQKLTVRDAHALQATAYNLLLDAAFAKRTGASMILYSKAEDWKQALRNVDNTRKAKQRFLMLRNLLVAAHFRTATNRFRLHYQIARMEFATAPEFRATQIQKVQGYWQRLTPAEQSYIQTALQFVFRERWAAFRGYGTQALSALWKTSLEEKRIGYTSLTDLRLIAVESDRFPIGLTFHRKGTRPVPFRPGDRVILYPHTAYEARLDRHPLLRGTIVEITPDTLRCQLLNVVSSVQQLQQWERWAVEEDINLSLMNRWIDNLALLLYAPARQRQRVLGIRAPAPPQALPNLPQFPYLTRRQQQLLHQCLSSPDYFLVQGPPGSGKTSRFLRALVEVFVRHWKKRVLLITYTNRAADEICAVLEKQNIPFLRLGTPAATAFPAATLHGYSRQQQMEALPALVRSLPCVVSTAASLVGSPEYLNQQFDVAIVDEASQLLELHLAGILSFVPRFVLIGDEKQLPAVVQQSAPAVLEDVLASLDFEDFRESLFTRLLRRCQQQQWDWCFGMLTEQGRMHREIQEVVNALFYDGKLRPLHERQQASHSPIFRRFPHHPLFQLLQTRRVLFIPTPPGQQSKLNEVEARWIAHFVNACARYDPAFSAQRIGVIAPFRAQIGLIQQYLSASARQQVTVDTVERFQGSERDIILLSLCLHSPRQLAQIQSLDAEGKVDRKLNVALTRAREHLLVFGTPEVLEQAPVYNRFLQILQRQQQILADPEPLFRSLEALL